jgi:GntR family transcriptional regulator
VIRNRTRGYAAPAYYQVMTEIQKEIENGRWKPDAMIPSERQLAEIHKVSIGTIKRATLALVNEGYLYRIQGKGTYVAGTLIKRENLRHYRFLKHFTDEEDVLSIKFLQLNKISAIESINRFLQIKSNQGLYEVKRLIISGKTPLAYVLSYFPQKMFKGLEGFSRTRFERIALYYALEQHYGITTVYNSELIGATHANEETAALLHIKKGTPVLYLETLAFTYKEKPYEYRQSFCLTDTKRVLREW